MFRSFVMTAALSILSVACCSAAEFGVLGGYGAAAASMTATAGGTSANAGFQNGPGVGALVGDNFRKSKIFGGEVRYLLLFDSLKVSQGGTQATLSGRSHLFHYDVLLHARPPRSPVRPFLAVGGGARFVEGTGAQQAYQPLSQYALLTQTHEFVPLISAGGGVKFKLSPRINLRAEIRDYISPHLSNVITASPGANLHGWIHEIVSLAALTYTFGGPRP
jgi:hypothetical protein